MRTFVHDASASKGNAHHRWGQGIRRFWWVAIIAWVCGCKGVAKVEHYVNDCDITDLSLFDWNLHFQNDLFIQFECEYDVNGRIKDVGLGKNHADFSWGSDPLLLELPDPELSFGQAGEGILRTPGQTRSAIQGNPVNPD